MRSITINEAFRLALEHHRNGNLPQAEYIYKEILKIRPDSFMIFNNLGNLCHKKGQFEEAITYYRKAVEINPDFDAAYYNMGNALKDMNRMDEAVHSYQKAISINPNLVGAYYNLGAALQETNRLDEAMNCYEKTLDFNPDVAEAHYGISEILLLTGKYEQGWKEFEWRRRIKDYFIQNITGRVWDGSGLPQKTLLILGEQGFGDLIQFIRYARMAAQRCKKVILVCPKELGPLLKNVDGISGIVPYGQKFPEFDAYCYLLTLPLIFNTTVENIPAEIPYILPDPPLVEKWAERVRPAGTKLKIGLVWSSGKGLLTQKKSCSLDMFVPFALTGGVTFYSLQKGEAAGQAKNPPEGMELIDYAGEFRDFSDTAAFIANLDLVVSVDTAVAHVAGALGKPVWILIPFASDWRWLLDRDDSPWYPTIRIFRQPSPGNWEPVIMRVADNLRALAGGDRARLLPAG